MSKDSRKHRRSVQVLNLSKSELANSGVGKFLLKENEKLKQEVDILKRSLKVVQNELEKMRGKNHELDKANGILDYRLTVTILPEFIKFIASSVGAGLAVNFFFVNEIKSAIISLVVSIIIYVGILFLYKKQ